MPSNRLHSVGRNLCRVLLINLRLILPSSSSAVLAPLERFGAFVVGVNVVTDRGLEIGDVGEGAAAAP